MRHTAKGEESDAVIDVRAIFQQSHRDLSVSALPDLLLPRKGRFGLIDYEKAFCAEAGDDDIFDLRSIDREKGCVVIVRPDQHVADVLPIDDHDAIADFFGRFMRS